MYVYTDISEIDLKYQSTSISVVLYGTILPLNADVTYQKL